MQNSTQLIKLILPVTTLISSQGHASLFSKGVPTPLVLEELLISEAGVPVWAESGNDPECSSASQFKSVLIKQTCTKNDGILDCGRIDFANARSQVNSYSQINCKKAIAEGEDQVSLASVDSIPTGCYFGYNTVSERLNADGSKANRICLFRKIDTGLFLEAHKDGVYRPEYRWICKAEQSVLSIELGRAAYNSDHEKIYYKPRLKISGRYNGEEILGHTFDGEGDQIKINDSKIVARATSSVNGLERLVGGNLFSSKAAARMTFDKVSGKFYYFKKTRPIPSSNELIETTIDNQFECEFLKK